MAGERQIKRRIKSAKNISQITKAMQMVAASRMKKAQEAAVLGKPYQEKIWQTVSELAEGVDRSLHPLLKVQKNQGGKMLNIVIATNKGLCGGLNTNLFRAINRWYGSSLDIDYVAFGKKAESFIVRSGRKLAANFSDEDFLKNVSSMTAFLVDGFLTNQYRSVNLLFNKFINSLKQMPEKRTLLPIGAIADFNREKKDVSDFLIEPSAKELLDSLLPHYLRMQVRSAILESLASEHSARMIAMKNATDNANSLISDLTLEYNQLRQQRITYEIADIVTARIGIC